MSLGFDGFLYPLPPSLPLTVRLLSLKFCLVFVVDFFFFFWGGGYVVDFWMDADCGASGLAMGLGLLWNVDGLWWWWLIVASR